MTEPTDPIASAPTEAASPADTAADAANSAAVEPAVRTVYPAGWPAEVLNTLPPDFSSAVEALGAALDSAVHRLRPVSVMIDDPGPTAVLCMLLTPAGEPVCGDTAIAIVQAAADARGIWVSRFTLDVFRLSFEAPELRAPDIADEPTVEAPVRRRRVS